MSPLTSPWVMLWKSWKIWLFRFGLNPKFYPIQKKIQKVLNVWVWICWFQQQEINWIFFVNSNSKILCHDSISVQYHWPMPTTSETLMLQDCEWANESFNQLIWHRFINFRFHWIKESMSMNIWSRWSKFLVTILIAHFNSNSKIYFPDIH